MSLPSAEAPDAARSRVMRAVRGRDTGPELALRRLLHGLGYRFRLHRKGLPGTPDLVFSARRKAVFVHGCFWHLHQGCRYAKMPATRPSFWKAKLEANVERDRRAVENLQALGWRVLCVWECSTRDAEAAAGLQGAMNSWIESSERLGEIGVPSRS